MLYEQNIVHAFKGLVPVTYTIILDTVCYMNDLVHAFRDAGLGAVTDTIIFDTVCYINESHSINRENLRWLRCLVHGGASRRHEPDQHIQHQVSRPNISASELSVNI